MVPMSSPALFAVLALLTTPPGSGTTTASLAPRVAMHCQVPCGIYGDKMRIDMMEEDAATLRKGMAMILKLAAEQPPNFNQIVRWTTTKDQHAQKVQDLVASYWLAQRIKAPKATDASDRAKYLHQLELMHGITVAAMKCKQTTESRWVDKLEALVLEFSRTYFSAEDLKHIEEHIHHR